MPDRKSSSNSAASSTKLPRPSYRKIAASMEPKHFDANSTNGDGMKKPSPPIQMTKTNVFKVQHANRTAAPMKPHPTLDIAHQRFLMQQRQADLAAAMAYRHATTDRLKPADARHGLCQLVVESHRWRTALKKGPVASGQLAGGFIAPTFTRQQPNKAPAAIMDVSKSRQDFHGLLSDIDVLMTNPVVVESGDAKNTYQKILVNLSQLGIFRAGPCH